MEYKIDKAKFIPAENEFDFDKLDNFDNMLFNP